MIVMSRPHYSSLHRSSCRTANLATGSTGSPTAPSLNGTCEKTRNDPTSKFLKWEVHKTSRRIALAPPGGCGLRVTREMFTAAGRATRSPRRWAAALHAAGAAGIRYQSRFTTTARANAFGLFDVAGSNDWPAHLDPISGTEACAEEACCFGAADPSAVTNHRSAALIPRNSSRSRKGDLFVV